MSEDRKPALNSTSFRNKALTFTFTAQDSNDKDIPFPFYDQINEWKGEKKRRLGYKVNDIYYLSPKTGEMEPMLDEKGKIIPYETVFLTELAHVLIELSGCSSGDKITLLFKTGKTKTGKAFSKWFLCKGNPTFNESGEITNLKCDKDFLEKVEDKKTMDEYATGEIKAVEPELNTVTSTPPIEHPQTVNNEGESELEGIRRELIDLTERVTIAIRDKNQEEIPF